MLNTKEGNELLAALGSVALSADATGCSEDLIVVSKAALEQLEALACRLLEANRAELRIGVHTHRFGDSVYAFLVEPGKPFGEEEFEQELEEDFEPEREEFLSVLDAGEPVRVAKLDANGAGGG